MTRILMCSVFILLTISICNGATVPAVENITEENNSLAKTSATIMDVFEDVRWFFERLAIFCDMVERILPPEKLEVQTPPPLSVGLTLQAGFRHFVFGVREISKSIVRVLSDKEIREYKQLSRATYFAHDLVKSVGEFFKNLRILIGNIFSAYTFYVPEMMLSKCMGNYLLHTYPQRPLYEYPVLLVNDIVDAFRTLNFDDELTGNATGSNRKLGSGSEISFDKQVEQNEILDDEIYVFHNTPVSPSPELIVKNEESAAANNSSVKQLDEDVIENTTSLDFATKLEASFAEPPSWKKCVQMYATETIFRKLEFYFLEMGQ